jgi:hypothetical protein
MALADFSRFSKSSTPACVKAMRVTAHFLQCLITFREAEDGSTTLCENKPVDKYHKLYVVVSPTTPFSMNAPDFLNKHPLPTYLPKLKLKWLTPFASPSFR